MMNQEKTTTSISSSLFRNTSYNLITQGGLVVLAIWAIPVLVHGLGDEKFGILALLWAVVGYFSLLDLGISRANTKFLAEADAMGDKKLSSRITWTSLTVSGGLGLVMMGAVLASTPLLLSKVFKIAPELQQEVSQAFFYAAISLPFMLVFGTIKGVQMALLRFDLVNVFQGGMSLLQWIGSVILVWCGYGLKEILLLTFLLRVISTGITFLLLRQLIPEFYRNAVLIDSAILKKLLHFGGWVTVSQIVSPLFMYLDRILIGAFLSLTAVAYYSVPQEALSRLLIVPVSLSIVLFPVFSGRMVAGEDQAKIWDLYYRSIKYLGLLMLPVALMVAIHAQEILHLWVGAQYGKQSAMVLQIISFGFLLNSVALVPSTVIQAFGRPDLTAKFHLLELPLVVILNVVLIPVIGIVGAGIAWSIRISVDTVLLFAYARKVLGTPTSLKDLRRYLFRLRYEFSLAIIFLFGLFFVEDTVVRASVSVVFLLAYFPWVWLRGFDDRDRVFLGRLLPMPFAGRQR